jgi:hypothetical protein
MNKCTFFTFLFLPLISNHVYADRTPYQKSVKIFEESEHYLVLHYHDWNEKFGNIRIIDKNNKNNIAEKEIGAFTYIHITKNEKYIVLLSNIKIHNNYQLLVMKTNGDLVHAREIKCNQLSKESLCGESVSNYVWWYHENADINLLKKNGKFILELNAPSLKRETIVFDSINALD